MTTEKPEQSNNHGNTDHKEEFFMVELEKETSRIRGAVCEVCKGMGCGFLESVFQQSLQKEFKLQGIPFEAQKELNLSHKGELLKQTFKPDFICCGSIIVELKAALLINLGHCPQAEIERIGC